MAEAIVSRHEAGILQVAAFFGHGEAVAQFVSTIAGARKLRVVPSERTIDVIEVAPSRWWVLFNGDRPCCDGLEPVEGCAVDLSSSRLRLALRHPRWREVLAKGCGIDLTGRHFTMAGHAMTAIGHYNVLLRVPEGIEGCDIYVGRSLALDLASWLADAVLEFEHE